jgi:hypothetical protein
MPYKRLSRFSRYFVSPKFWLFGWKVEFFNSHRRLHSSAQCEAMMSAIGILQTMISPWTPSKTARATIALMSQLPDSVIQGLGIVLWAAPWLLVAIAWWRSLRQAALPSGSALIVGNILATVSCCWLLPFAVPNTTHWEQLRVNVLSYGVVVSAACALLAICILPFARPRVKWFSLSGSALNACMIALFFLSLD